MSVLTRAKKTQKTGTSRKSATTNRTNGIRRTTINSGPKLMRWRQERGIPRKLFAEMADFSERKLATYEKSSVLPSKVRRPVTETVRLVRALEDLAGDRDALKAWLERRNPAFNNQSPLQLITRGESDALWRMVHQLRQGSYQ
jgi:hypothetical protein